MVSLSTISAGALTICLLMVGALFNGNIRRWAQEKGHDVYILRLLSRIPKRWLWVSLVLICALLVWPFISPFIYPFISPFLPEALQYQNGAKEGSPPPPANSASDNKSDRSPPAYGGLYLWQAKIFMSGLEVMRADLGSKIMIARPQMVEPQQFSRAFETAAMRAGFDPIVLQQNPASRDQTGVLVAVPDVDAPSPSALKMQALIKQLGFEGRFIPLLDASSKQAAPVHATDVGNFAIYIGPSSLQ